MIPSFSDQLSYSRLFSKLTQFSCFIVFLLKQLKQENRWKQRMLLKWLVLSIKGRTCNPTPLVHQDMTNKSTAKLGNIRPKGCIRKWEQKREQEREHIQQKKTMMLSEFWLHF